MSLCEDGAGAKAVEKEMKIEQAGVFFPGREELASFIVVGAGAKTEMLTQIVPAADVIAGEDVEAAHAAKQSVFGGPAADAADGEKFFESVGVAERAERFEIEFTGCDGAAKFENGAFFVLAVAEGAKRAGGEGREIGGRRASPRGGVGGSGVAKVLNEAVQQHDADVEGNLLAGDGIEESFKDRGIARRLEASESSYERAELFVFCGEGIEIAEIDIQAEHAVEFGANRRLDFGDAVRRFQFDAQARMRGRPNLLDGDFDGMTARFCFERKSATINLTVPAIENVFRTAAEGPDREIEAKGRERSKQKCSRRRCGWTGYLTDRAGIRCETSRVLRHVAIIYRP